MRKRLVIAVLLVAATLAVVGVSVGVTRARRAKVTNQNAGDEPAVANEPQAEKPAPVANTDTRRKAEGSSRAIGLKGLKVPLEYYPDGSPKAILKAEISTVNASGDTIKGENLRYETFLEGGATDVVITADSCTYNRAKGQAESDERVKLEKQNVLITGEGFTLDSKKEMISLHSNVVVKFEQGLMSREKKE